MPIKHLLRDYPAEGDVYVGRVNWRVGEDIEGHDGYFGNPYIIDRDGDRATVITKFEAWARERLKYDHEYRDRVRALHGKTLICWCHPDDCHARVLLMLADELCAMERMNDDGGCA